MDAIIAAIRSVHIAAGMIALVVAPGAMLTVKGGRAHRRWGQIYFWTMAVVALTAVILALYRPIAFLVLVAVFSFYAALSGYRALYRKRPEQGQRATAFDWTVAVVAVAASAGLVVFGVLQPTVTWARFGTVTIVLGAVGVFLGGRDLWQFVWPPRDRRAWWFNHMRGMLGSYVATLTAFSAVNFTSLSLTTRWLWPTVVCVPLIVLWVTYYRIRFRRARGAMASVPA